MHTAVYEVKSKGGIHTIVIGAYSCGKLYVDLRAITGMLCGLQEALLLENNGNLRVGQWRQNMLDHSKYEWQFDRDDTVVVLPLLFEYCAYGKRLCHEIRYVVDAALLKAIGASVVEITYRGIKPRLDEIGKQIGLVRDDIEEYQGVLIGTANNVCVYECPRVSHVRGTVKGHIFSGTYTYRLVGNSPEWDRPIDGEVLVVPENHAMSDATGPYMCPVCGETDYDYLIPNDDDSCTCDRCGEIFPLA